MSARSIAWGHGHIHALRLAGRWRGRRAAYEAYIRVGGERLRRRFGTVEEARAWIDAQDPVTGAGLTLSGAQVRDAAAALALLPPGVRLERVAEEWLAAHAGLDSLDPERLFADFLAAKAQSLRPKTLQGYASDLRRFLRHLGADEGVYRVMTREEVEGFLSTLTPSAHNHALLSLGAAFSWAVKTGRLKETADPTRGLELVKLAAPKREVLTVEDGARVLSIAEASGRGAYVAYLALGMFAGLRPEETLRLRPGDIGAEYITLSEGTTKTADARTVAIRPNLRVILDAYPVGPLGVAGGLTADRFRRLLRSTIEAGGVALPHDVLRHSFASYSYESGRDAAATAYELGHKGTQMLFKHYRGLVPPGSGARWFALLPPSISPSSAHGAVS